MVKVIVQKNTVHKCWYINEISDNGRWNGKVCYESREKALEVARKQHPYVNINVEE